MDLLYLENYYLKSNKRYNNLRELLNSKMAIIETQNKFLLPRFYIQKYNTFQINEIEIIMTDIKDFYNTLIKNKILIKEINDIIENKYY